MAFTLFSKTSDDSYGRGLNKKSVEEPKSKVQSNGGIWKDNMGLGGSEVMDDQMEECIGFLELWRHRCVTLTGDPVQAKMVLDFMRKANTLQNNLCDSNGGGIFQYQGHAEVPNLFSSLAGWVQNLPPDKRSSNVAWDGIGKEDLLSFMDWSGGHVLNEGRNLKNIDGSFSLLEAHGLGTLQPGVGKNGYGASPGLVEKGSGCNGFSTDTVPSLSDKDAWLISCNCVTQEDSSRRRSTNTGALRNHGKSMRWFPVNDNSGQVEEQRRHPEHGFYMENGGICNGHGAVSNFRGSLLFEENDRNDIHKAMQQKGIKGFVGPEDCPYHAGNKLSVASQTWANEIASVSDDYMHTDDSTSTTVMKINRVMEKTSIHQGKITDNQVRQTLHDGIFYVLPYLSLEDLLSIEQVCKPLHEAVRNDVLLWQTLHIEPPLSKKLTDEALLRMAMRAQGHLVCLSLVECTKVTEMAIEEVLNHNPMIFKLYLPGCTRINPDAVVRMVKQFNENRPADGHGLRQLRIRGLHGVTTEHLEILKSVLSDGAPLQAENFKPQFYHNGHYLFSGDDGRAIDVETCPKCGNVRIVYDCTRDRCQQRQALKLQQCRGCTFCIARCEECGNCIDDTEYEETFSLDLLCAACWRRLPKCKECNRPGCGRHADHFIRSPDTTFMCADCRGSSPGEAGPEFYVP